MNQLILMYIRKVETKEDTITEKEKLLSLLDDDDIF